MSTIQQPQTNSRKVGRTVSLSPEDWETINEICPGNLSQGVRIALRFLKETNQIPKVDQRYLDTK